MRSIRSVLAGLLILLVASGLLFWNEGRTLAAEEALDEGAHVVVAIANATVDPKNEGKLIHLTGQTAAPQKLRDPDFGVETPGLRLSRKVEMFQWKEGRAARGGGGGTEADFTYKRDWSAEPIDWTKFRFPQDHRNPPMPGVASRDVAAEDARIGAFQIDDRVIAKLGKGEPFNVSAAVAATAAEKLGQPTTAIQGGIFAGADAASPRIGDVRVFYTVLPHQAASVVGRQAGERVAAFTGSSGREVLLARPGRFDAEDMFGQAQSQNAVMSWGVRLFGAVLIYFGCRVILHPLRMIASYVPLVDSLASLSAAVAALVATLVIAPLIIGLAWLFYRPLTAVVIIAGGASVAWLLAAYHRRSRLRVPATPG